MTADTSSHHRLYYRITQSDHDALRRQLSAGTASASAGSVHRMFFASYRDCAGAQTMEELLLPGEEARFSLQYLDNDPSCLTLERRRDGRHTSAAVSEAECRALLAGETAWLRDRRDPVLLDFYEGLTERMLLPRALYSYRQEVYVRAEAAVWVALHTDLRYSLEHMDFLDPQRLAVHTAEQEGRSLLAIGYTDFIPENVLSLLEEAAPGRKLLGRRKR